MAKVKSDKKPEGVSETAAIEASEALEQIKAEAVEEGLPADVVAAIPSEPLPLTESEIHQGQKITNIEPALPDSDASTLTKASVEKLIGSEVHGTPSEFTPSDIAEIQALVDAGGGSVKLSDGDDRDLRTLMARAQEDHEIIATDGGDEEITEPAPAPQAWTPTHRVVTKESTYLVMVIDHPTESYAWTHPSWNAQTPFTLHKTGGEWLQQDGEILDGNVHALPAE